MPALTLSELSIGQTATVARVDGEPRMRVRLMEMGFVAGTRVKLLKRATWGDPLQFALRGYHLSLRRAEASFIAITTESPRET